MKLLILSFFLLAGCTNYYKATIETYSKDFEFDTKTFSIIPLEYQKQGLGFKENASLLEQVLLDKGMKKVESNPDYNIFLNYGINRNENSSRIIFNNYSNTTVTYTKEIEGDFILIDIYDSKTNKKIYETSIKGNNTYPSSNEFLLIRECLFAVFEKNFPNFNNTLNFEIIEMPCKMEFRLDPKKRGKKKRIEEICNQKEKMNWKIERCKRDYSKSNFFYNLHK